ncbi:ABC transporter permease [Pseudomonas sp. PS01303]|jgi:lipopolysaccharide transport system permease protein|uniref:ABC transporter permease n=1 Tax=Pseudomonas sp. PS01303 TaxID=2991439 RepID=UPI002499B80B|nr:ABC transporter permease [Pseudomonas sp. PS01303]
MKNYSASPLEMINSFWCNKRLIMQLSKREVLGRYRGSTLGLSWSFFNPILMLVIYTFVFSVVFKARWGVSADESKTDFAIILFVGLLIHGLFAECINKAPGLITSNVSYVKKVVFPVEVLSWVAFMSALFHAAISLVVLLLAQLVFKHSIPWTAILLPFVLLPLFLSIMGLSWLFASLGVYLRDITQITVMFTTVMLFMSAVFFPVTALPEKYQVWIRINPLAYIIEQSRNVLIFGQVPDLLTWSIMLVIGGVVAWCGFAWFQKTRKGFADVL